jgi:hypothetical protein
MTDNILKSMIFRRRSYARFSKTPLYARISVAALLDLGSRPTTYSISVCRPACLPTSSSALFSAAALLASWMPSCSPLGCHPARLSAAALLASRLPPCSPLGCNPAHLSAACLLASRLLPCSPHGCSPARLSAAAPGPARLSDAVLLASWTPSCSPLGCRPARLSAAAMLAC